MPYTSRETIYSALFDLLSKTPGIVRSYRYFIPIDQIDQAALPALCMRQIHEAVSSDYGVDYKFTATVEVLLVCQTPIENTDVVPATSLNALLDAFEMQISPTTPNNVQQLGLDNVGSVDLNGTIVIDEAMRGSSQRSAALVPLTLVYV